MAQVFSDYLRSLGPGGEPSDPRVFGELWQALRERLRRELRRRGLWEVSPSFLGVEGWSRWEGAERGEGDALDELVASCYTYVFLERLGSLRAQLRVKTDVEGLVVRSVRNFLHDTQKRRDPLGYRVFVVLRSALERCLASGRLHVVQGGPKIANDTVFSFVPDPEISPAEESTLRQLVPAWNDQLLPELVTGRGEAEREVVERLAECVLGLREERVEAFVFRSLIDPLKLDVRARWAALLAEETGDGTDEEASAELTRLLRSIGPDVDYEERESFEKLVECVSEGLERLQGRLRQKTQRYLASLWQFLRVFAVEGGALRFGGSADLLAAAGASELPSQRQLAQLLGIPRERLNELFSSLGEVIERCLPPGALKTPLDSVWRARPAPREGGAMALQDLQERLRQQTTEALRRALPIESETGAAGGPRVGDVFALPESADAGVEWVLVRSAPGRSARFLAVAADPWRMRGSADVAVPGATGEAPLTLRGRCVAWLDAEQLARGSRSRRVGEETIEAMLEKRTALETDRPLGTVLEREVDADPEYRDWLEEICALATQIGTAEPRRAGTTIERRPSVPLTRLSNPWALAASILLLVGLGGGLWREHALRSFLETRLDQTETERRLEQEQHQRTVQEIQREHTAETQSLETRIAELEQGLGEAAEGAFDNSAYMTLNELGSVRGDDSIELPAVAPGIWLLLPLPSEATKWPTYRLQMIETSQRKKILSRKNLRESPDTGELTVFLPRSQLRPGRYQLLLYREGEASSQPTAKYAIEIVFKK